MRLSGQKDAGYERIMSASEGALRYVELRHKACSCFRKLYRIIQFSSVVGRKWLTHNIEAGDTHHLKTGDVSALHSTPRRQEEEGRTGNVRTRTVSTTLDESILSISYKENAHDKAMMRLHVRPMRSGIMEVKKTAASVYNSDRQGKAYTTMTVKSHKERQESRMTVKSHS